MLPQTIKRLKVKASHIHDFPFDVFYVVPKTAEDLIPRLFPYSLCVAFSPDLVDLLKHVRVEEHQAIQQHQVVTLSNPKKTALVGKPFNEFIATYELLQSYCVVPMLSFIPPAKRKQGTRDRFARYLTSTKFRSIPHREPAQQTPFRTVFNDEARLFTPEGMHSPICQICPRSMHHMRGDCSLGEKICHETLIIKPDKRAENREQLPTHELDGDSSIGTGEPVPADT